jgi:sterol desaturase/sphingolipid hydroxylase (fatty acid hydroxylase superfamily)
MAAGMAVAEQILADYGREVGATCAPLLAFVVLERLFPVERGPRLRRALVNVVYLAFALLALMLMAPLLARAHAALKAAVGGGLIELPLSLQGAVPQAAVGLLSVFVWDFCQYWAHRAQHAVPFLWETHKLHHSETALGATTSFRNHITSHLLFSFAVVLPTELVFEGFTWSPVVAVLFFRLFGLFNHMNVRLPLGAATPLISGPQLHRLHHSRLPQHRDKNFSALFPVFDVVFGTYRRPARGEWPPTGLDSGEEMNDLRSFTVSPFVAWGAALLRGARR